MLSGDEGMFIIHLLGMTHFPKAVSRWQINLGIHAIFSSSRFWTVRHFIFSDDAREKHAFLSLLRSMGNNHEQNSLMKIANRKKCLMKHFFGYKNTISVFSLMKEAFYWWGVISIWNKSGLLFCDTLVTNMYHNNQCLTGLSRFALYIKSYTSFVKAYNCSQLFWKWINFSLFYSPFSVEGSKIFDPCLLLEPMIMNLSQWSVWKVQLFILSSICQFS